MEWRALAKDGKLTFSNPQKRASLARFLVEYSGVALVITALLPESTKQRRFYHGAVLPLWAYLNDLDYHNHDVLNWLHEQAKEEFNGKFVVLDGKSKKMGQSTKGNLNAFCERVIDHLEAQYGVDRSKLLEPKNYKHWNNTIRPYGGPDNYIDYLLEIRLLPVAI